MTSSYWLDRKLGEEKT